jgi:hypothetical protein
MLFLESRLGYQPAGEPQHCYYCIEPCKGMFTLDQYAGRDATAFVPSPTTRRTTCSRSRSATNPASACRKRDERAARSTSCKPSVITTDGTPGPVDIGSTKRLAGDHGRKHPSCRHPRTTSGK